MYRSTITLWADSKWVLTAKLVLLICCRHIAYQQGTSLLVEDECLATTVGLNPVCNSCVSEQRHARCPGTNRKARNRKTITLVDTTVHGHCSPPTPPSPSVTPAFVTCQQRQLPNQALMHHLLPSRPSVKIVFSKRLRVRLSIWLIDYHCVDIHKQIHLEPNRFSARLAPIHQTSWGLEQRSSASVVDREGVVLISDRRLTTNAV